MEPNFCDGDRLRLEESDGEVSRWQLIYFRLPQNESRDFFKRVVGLPGETIEIRDETIFIDGRQIDGDVYGKDPPNYTMPPVEISEGEYFVLGDNRRSSFDSHAWVLFSGTGPLDGGVPADLIPGELPADTKGCEQ